MWSASSPPSSALREDDGTALYRGSRVAPFPNRASKWGRARPDDPRYRHALDLAGSAVKSVDAVGMPVLARNIDLANARITFASGCVANVTASRVSYKTERRMRVFGRSHYLNCDLGEGKIFGYSLRGDPMTEGLAAIATETHDNSEAGQSGQRDELIPRLHCQRHQAAGRWSRRFRGFAGREHDQSEHRGASGEGAGAARPVGRVSLGRAAVDDVEHDFGGALARGRGRCSPSALATSPKPCNWLARTASEPRISAAAAASFGAVHSS